MLYFIMLAVGITGGSSANVYAYQGSEWLKPSRSLNKDLKEPIPLRLNATSTNTDVEYRAQDQINTLISRATQDIYTSQNSLFKTQIISSEQSKEQQTDEDKLLSVLQDDPTDSENPQDKISEDQRMLITSSDEKIDEDTSTQPYATADSSEVESILSFGINSDQYSFRSETTNNSSSDNSSSET